MRKIIAGLFVTLDGVVESPQDWQFPYFNDELGAALGAGMQAADTLLLGRNTYDMFAGFWPTSQDDMADYMNNTPKYVVSSTLQKADWQNTTIIDGDVAAGITKLKKAKGKNISLSGSPSLALWLLQEKLLDELWLIVCPIVVGSGAKLFPEGTEQLPLRLASSETFKTGVLSLTYTRAED